MILMQFVWFERRHGSTRRFIAKLLLQQQKGQPSSSRYTSSSWGPSYTSSSYQGVAAWVGERQSFFKNHVRRQLGSPPYYGGIRWSTISKRSTVVDFPSSIRFFSASRIIMSADMMMTSSTPPSSNQEDGEEDDLYNELKWVSTEIQRHDHLYYSSSQQQQQQAELTDDEFDALVQREQQLAETYPHLLRQWQEESGLGIRATRDGRVGVSVMEDEEEEEKRPSTILLDKVEEQEQSQELRLKRQHLAPMLSLDNVYNDEQLWAWLKRIPKVFDEDLDNPTMQHLVTIYTEPKLDGVSLSLRYNKVCLSSSSSSSDTTYVNYQLEWASTRGDGQQGQDVTFAVRTIKESIPHQLKIDSSSSSLPETFEIRGEIILPNSDFQKIPELMPNVTFSNARNAASGILLRKETDEETALQEASQLRNKLRFYAYDMVVGATGESLDMDGDEVQNLLLQMGFSIPSPVAKTVLSMTFNETMDDWSLETISPMISFYQGLKVHREGTHTSRHPMGGPREWKFGGFEMDGCVHKISQFSIRQLLGRSMKSPKWAVAHKFPPKAVITKLLNVTIQVGRTGALTPVAILEPVDVDGVTIQRATLHNFGHLQEVLGGTTTAVGTSVLVRRAGEVIPQVVQRIGDSQSNKTDREMISLEAPQKCPACGSPVIVDETTSTGVGQVLRCGGPPLLCPPRAVTSLAHAFSRDAMDVTGLSEARIQQLMDAGILRLPSDLFKLSTEGWEQIQELPGWGPKSCRNLRTTAERVATTGVSLSRFIYSLGIRHVGKGSSELVASCYLRKDDFLEALDKASKDLEVADDESIHQPFSALQGQLGIGPVMIQSLSNFSKSQELLEAAKELGQVVRVIDEENTSLEQSKSVTSAMPSRVDLPWKGLRVVFTGSIPDYSRSEAQNLAKRLGAKATPGSVSKSTDLVIFGDKGGKKLDQADALGIRTMTAEEFVQLVQETLPDSK